MKSQKGLTLVGTIFFVLIIAFIVFGIVYYVRMQTTKEELEDMKTDLLLVQAKVKKISSDYILEKKDEILIGTKLTDIKAEPIIQEFLNNNSIDIEEKDKKYYALNQQNLDEMGLPQVKLEENSYYIVEYTEGTVYYTKGYELAGSSYYDIDNIEGLKLEQ